jgi:hypothetical protein
MYAPNPITSDLMSVQCVPKASFNPALLTGSYQAMNGTGFSDNVKILKLYNASTTVSIDISLDGVTDHDFIPPLGTLIVDFQTNHSDGTTAGTGILNLRRNQILYGKIAANPTYLQIIGYR